MMMYEQKMKNANLKVTPLRITIIDYLSRYFQNGVTVDSLYLFLVKKNEKITISSLYRILREFVIAGIVTVLDGEKKQSYLLVA